MQLTPVESGSTTEDHQVVEELRKVGELDRRVSAVAFSVIVGLFWLDNDLLTDLHPWLPPVLAVATTLNLLFIFYMIQLPTPLFERKEDDIV